MAVSDHFAAAALNVKQFRPATLPLWTGSQARTIVPPSRSPRSCTICRTWCARPDTYWGALLKTIGFSPGISCPVSTTDVGARACRSFQAFGVGSTNLAGWSGVKNATLIIAHRRPDAQGALLHLGYYESGRLMRGVFLHHESGFVRYLSPRSSITYERGLVEGPLLPAFHDGHTLALVHRTFRVWRRRLLKRVVSGAPLRQRSRVSAYVH